MTTLLQINSGMQGDASHSSQLADMLVRSLISGRSDVHHIRRDLGKDPFPHLGHETYQAFLNPTAPLLPPHKAGLVLSDQLIAELKEADIVVLGVPMYNFMVPSPLKSWIDYISRAGQTFRFTENGPMGLLEDKRTYIVVTQGGQFLGAENDLLTPYLRMALGHIGIRDIHFIYAPGLAQGPAVMDAGLASAKARIQSLTQPYS